MPTNTAQVSDLQARMLRPLLDVETAWAPTALDDAFQQLMIRVPGLGTKLDDTTIPAGDPIRLVTLATQCAMVKRVLINPDGVLEETTDDYTRRLDATISTGQMLPTDTELETLSVAVGNPEGAFAVRAVPQAYVPGYFPTTTTDTWPPMSLGGVW